MTAGRGITHSERFERARQHGGALDAIQAWVALPEADEESEPAFSHHGAGDLPAFDEGGVRGRLLAGQALGLRSNVRTHSPMFYLHWQLEAGARPELPAGVAERAAYVVSGNIQVDGQRFQQGQMLVFASGRAVAIEALTGAVVMALGGEPLGPRFIEWNFVSSSKQRIDEAKADWRAGRMKLPDADADEHIPLPPDPCPPPNPMS